MKNMTHFSMKAANEGDDASDSDHRHKRRKMGQPGNSNGASGAPPANPNSFAAKMMAKMGYVEGQGLGATGRGRLAPIETQLRPQGVGLGAVKEKTKQAKEEEKREAAFRGVALEDSEEEEKKRRRRLREKRHTTFKDGSSTPTGRPKIKYRTATEIEAEAEGLQVPNVLKAIIDATGTEMKLLRSATGLMGSNGALVPGETEAVKIARRARRDLEAFAEEWNGILERKNYYDAQEMQLVQELDEEEQKSRNLEKLINTVQELQHLTLNPSAPDLHSRWEELTIKLESVEDALRGEIDAYLLQEIAVSVIHPLFKLSMQDWDPLEDPTRVVPWIERLRGVFDIKSDDGASNELALPNGSYAAKPQRKSTTPYETMICTLWLPPVRSAITNVWNVHESTPLITLVETWRPFLPPFVLYSLINQLIVRRLSDTLSAWKPRPNHKHRNRHSQNPYTWLIPWLPYLDAHHTDLKSPVGLLADVKRKLKSVFAVWDLTSEIPPGLTSWHSILTSELPAILLRHMLPRLAAHLSSNLVIDPSDQDLEPLTQVLQWTPFFSPNTITHLLIAEFFPKWHHTLYLWLTGEPNYDEIGEWYLWWKNQIHALAPLSTDNPAIAAEWTEGLQTINLALKLGPDAVSQLPPPRAGPAPPLASTVTPVGTPKTAPVLAPSETTFRDVVEDWCVEQSLIMMPLREADAQSGLPLFRITASVSGRGGVVVYLKGDVLWVREIGGEGKARAFAPAGLDDALVARAGGG